MKSTELDLRSHLLVHQLYKKHYPEICIRYYYKVNQTVFKHIIIGLERPKTHCFACEAHERARGGEA